MSDTTRLDWLAETLEHCPHAEIRHNTGDGADDDEYDDGEPIPVGWSLRILGCYPLRARAATFRELIDAAHHAALTIEEELVHGRSVG